MGLVTICPWLSSLINHPLFRCFPLISPRNDVRGTSAEIAYLHYVSLAPDLESASDWSCCEGNLPQPIRSATKIWEDTLHRISMEFLQLPAIVPSRNVGYFLGLLA